jgi:hypothetical protein
MSSVVVFAQCQIIEHATFALYLPLSPCLRVEYQDLQMGNACALLFACGLQDISPWFACLALASVLSLFLFVWLAPMPSLKILISQHHDSRGRDAA